MNLEEIKEWFNNDEELHEFQIEWLIKQAEKVEELLPMLNEAKENVQLAFDTVRIDEHDDALNCALDCLNYAIKEFEKC